MMPHLGVLAQVHPQAALEVFERDCLIYLGHVRGREGHRQTRQAMFPLYRPVVHAQRIRTDGRAATSACFRSATARRPPWRSSPSAASTVGAGPGKPIEREVRGGTVGLVLDARGRPLAPADRPCDRPCARRGVGHRAAAVSAARAQRIADMTATAGGAYTPGLKVVAAHAVHRATAAADLGRRAGEAGRSRRSATGRRRKPSCPATSRR